MFRGPLSPPGRTGTDPLSADRPVDTLLFTLHHPLSDSIVTTRTPACTVLVCLSIAVFAVLSAFPAKSVSALPPPLPVPTRIRPLAEISVPAHWPD